MHLTKRIIIASVIFGSGCALIQQSNVHPSLGAPFIFIMETAPITYISSAYKDSLGMWPVNRYDLNHFFDTNYNSFTKDSLFQRVDFNLNNFDSLVFVDLQDTLKIHFFTKKLDAENYYEETIQGWKYVSGEGTIIIFPDSLYKYNHGSDIEFRNIKVYNDNGRQVL